MCELEDENSEHLYDEYYSEDDCFSKSYRQTFKMPKRMDDYKLELATYFATNQDFKDGIRHMPYTLVGTWNSRKMTRQGWEWYVKKDVHGVHIVHKSKMKIHGN